MRALTKTHRLFSFWRDYGSHDSGRCVQVKDGPLHYGAQDQNALLPVFSVQKVAWASQCSPHYKFSVPDAGLRARHIECAPIRKWRQTRYFVNAPTSPRLKSFQDRFEITCGRVRNQDVVERHERRFAKCACLHSRLPHLCGRYKGNDVSFSSPFVRIFPCNRYGDENCRDRTNGLHPRRPVRGVKAESATKKDRIERGTCNQKKEENPRCIEHSDKSCHLGIIA